MKISVGTDMDAHLPRAVVNLLVEMGHEVSLQGAFVTSSAPWPKVAAAVAKAVAQGEADMGVVCCWTGTGISIAANKVKGIRAALCSDAETAAGARKWNDANVLALSIRSTTEQVAKEIIQAWFDTPPSEDPEDQICLEYLERMETLAFKQLD